MREALQVLYLKNDSSSLEDLLRMTQISVKTEVADHDEEHEFKADVKNIVDDHAFEDERADNYSDNEDENEDWKPEKKSIKKKREGSKDEDPILDLNPKKSANESIQCNLCEITFKQGGAYRRHKIIVHNENENDVKAEWGKLQQNFKWPCENCGTKFLNKHNMRVHTRKEHPKEENQKMPKKSTKKRKPPLKEWAGCPYCSKKVKTQYYLRAHIFNSHKDKRHLHSDIVGKYSCDKCDNELFFDKHALEYHQETQHSASATCKVCSKVLKNRLMLKTHMSVMHSDKSVVCEHCSREFKAELYLKRHIARQHSNTSQCKFPCTLCMHNKGRCNSEEGLQKHLLECHSGLEYQCEQCDKTFASPYARTSHKRNQHEEKTLQCDQCDKRFVLGSKLRAHMKETHQKTKDQICPHCGEAFGPHSQNFRAHVNRHTDNRQFGCDTCGKSFLVERHLKSHMKRHTLPYFCDKCDLRFGSSDALKDHTRIVHEQVQLFCRHGCGYSSWVASGRGRHEKSYCKLNPVPNAPYTITAGTANSLTLQVNPIIRSCKVCKLVKSSPPADVQSEA